MFYERNWLFLINKYYNDNRFSKVISITIISNWPTLSISPESTEPKILKKYLQIF